LNPSDEAAYGHFGRTDLNVPWEQTDMADTLKQAAGLTSAERLVEAA
jgi:S-adenosylmethionine synthetase